MNPGYIRGFDGLRALSITSVVLTHAGAFASWPNERLTRLVWGETGVNVFFALSGFLITRLLLAERSRTGTVALGKFYGRRFLRLLPPLILFAVIQSVLYLSGNTAFWPMGLLLSFLYLYNYVPRSHYDPVLGPTWSLAVEEQFYLFWPPLVKHLRQRWLMVVACAFILTSIAACYVLPAVTLPPSASGTLGDHYVVIRFFIPAAGTIMIGALAALLDQRTGLLNGVLGKLAPLLCTVLFVAPLWIPRAGMPVVHLLQTVGIALLLLWLVHRPEHPLVSLLEFAPLRYLGRISYGLYLYHAIFMGTQPGNGPVDDPWLGIALSLTLALLSYELVEKRALRLKVRLQ